MNEDDKEFREHLEKFAAPVEDPDLFLQNMINTHFAFRFFEKKEAWK
jgi:hypothetical protein